jgi:hypothetical protein
VDRDGAADLVIAPGGGGLSRVKLYDGSSLASGRLAELAPSFLAFAPGVTTGVNVAAGDVDGDGFSDVIVSLGPAGSSMVKVWSGATIAANPTFMPVNRTTMQRFYANGTGGGGVRVTAADINGDGRAELVTTPSTAASEWLRVVSVSSSSVSALAAVFTARTQPVVASGEAAGPTLGDLVPPGGPCLCCSPRPENPLCRRVSG